MNEAGSPDAEPRRGMTLVELLVVIAVIAILAALLFPVFMSAREKSRQAACASNLHQLGIAIALYRDDNEGRYPLRRDKGPDDPATVSLENHVNWEELIFPYLKNGVVMQWGKISYAGGVYHCPSDGKSYAPSYAINGLFIEGMPEMQITRPSETVLLAEKKGSIAEEELVWWHPPWPPWPLRTGAPIADREDAINAIEGIEPDPDNGFPDSGTIISIGLGEFSARGLQTRRHSGGANWLFTDGHVRWAKLTTIWGNATDTNQLNPTR